MGKVEFFRSSFGEFSESNSIVFFIEHDIYLMAVTFVMRRQLHIVAIDNPFIVLFINYYTTVTRGLLFKRTMPITNGATGWGSPLSTWENLVKTSNKGFELTIYCMARLGQTITSKLLGFYTAESTITKNQISGVDYRTESNVNLL